MEQLKDGTMEEEKRRLGGKEERIKRRGEKDRKNSVLITFWKY